MAESETSLTAHVSVQLLPETRHISVEPKVYTKGEREQSGIKE